MNKLLDYANENPLEYVDLRNEVAIYYPFSINTLQIIKEKYKHLPIQELVNLIVLQNKAKAKLPYADKWFYTDKNLQQASSYNLAKYHGALLNKFNCIADICCGIGSDLLFLSKNKTKCYAVDTNPEVLNMARHNMKYFKRENIVYQNTNAEDFKYECQAVFIDPDRRGRNVQNRLYDVHDLSPNWLTIEYFVKNYHNVAVKLSPILDYEDSLFADYSFDFVSEHGELKECLLKTGTLKSVKTAVILPQNIIFTEQTYPQTSISPIQSWLLEPDPAITRAHLVNDLAYHLYMHRIDDKIALLTSDTQPEALYGKVYNVIDAFNYNLKTLQQYIKSHDIGILDIKTKGFSETVESFRKKLKLKGSNKATIFIIRVGERHVCVSCTPH
jgi:SAM-dependent methyltransferase